MLDLLRQAVEGIMTIVNSLVSLISWIPAMLRMSSSTSGFWNFVPPSLTAIVAVTSTFFILKVILYGSDNK